MKVIKQHVISPLKKGEIVRVKPSRYGRLVACIVARCADADGCRNCVLEGRPDGCGSYWYYVQIDKGHARFSAKFIPIEDVVE